MYRAPSPYGQGGRDYPPQPPRAYSPQPPPQRAYSPQPPMQRSYSPQPPMQRSYSPQPPMQRSYSPQPPGAGSHGSQPPASGGQIAPGSMTYTTSVNADGTQIYHPFKAVAASYQTPNGIVSGIQWIPAEATHIVPAGAKPASSEFAASWNRGYLGKDDKALKDWQRDEERRRKREEKESAKRLREQQELRNDEKAREYERERRKSINAGSSPYMPFPQQTASSQGHPHSPYQPYADPSASPYGPPGAGGSVHGHERKHSSAGGYDALDRQFSNMDLNRPREYGERERKTSGAARSRRQSMSAGDERPGAWGSPYQGGSAAYNSSPYAPQGALGYAGSAGKYSPNPNHGELPYAPPANTYPGAAYSSSARGGSDAAARSTTPHGSNAGNSPQVYPRGHVMEGQPMYPRSRPSSPMPGTATSSGPYAQGHGGYYEPSGKIRSHSRPPSPRSGRTSPYLPAASLTEAAQLPPPESFMRPVNPGATFVSFNPTKIQDMEEFLLAPLPPRLPPVLKTHDVYPEDWQRLMNDVKLAWSGRLPVPSDSRSGQAPRRTTLVADLADLWNTSFFLSRGVELVLYKGRERRSGTKVGSIDYGLPEDVSPEASESEEEEDEDDESELEEYLARNANAYGRAQDFDPVIIARRRREAREEKRRARREREAKRKARAKERGKTYALYVTCVPAAGAVHGGMPGGYPPVNTTAYVPPPAAAGGGYGRYERY